MFDILHGFSWTVYFRIAYSWYSELICSQLFWYSFSGVNIVTDNELQLFANEHYVLLKTVDNELNEAVEIFCLLSFILMRLTEKGST